MKKRKDEIRIAMLNNETAPSALCTDGEGHVRQSDQRCGFVPERNGSLYGTEFYLKNPTPPGAAQAT